MTHREAGKIAKALERTMISNEDGLRARNYVWLFFKQWGELNEKAEHTHVPKLMKELLESLERPN